MLKTFIKSLVRMGGVDVVKYPPLHPLAKQLKSFMHANDINLVVDVGACDGGFAQFLRGPVGYEGVIASFEPTKRTFDILTTKMSSDSKWRGYNCGVSESDSQALLNTYGDNYDFNSILQLRESDAAVYAVDVENSVVEPITLRSLDSIWPDITSGIPNPRVYLKTDTQGHDRAVIKGVEPRLPFILGLQSEIPAVEIYDGMTSMSDMLKLVSELGYSPIGFHPINQPPEYNGMTPEFDVVFQKNTLNLAARPQSQSSTAHAELARA